MRRRAVLEERRDLALHDLADLEDQVATGEIDEATAARLRGRFEADAAAAIRALAVLDAPDDPNDASAPRRARRGLAAAAGLAAVVAVGAALALPQFLRERPAGGFVTGNEATGQGRDLSEVTNEEMEQVVAANPDVVPMRLRLAHRYLDDGQLRKAFEHYMAILDQQPHPEAMSHLAWIVFNDGDTDLALELLEASRTRAPDDAETLWFLANVHLYGRDDPGAALPLLADLVTREDLASQRAQVEQALEDARRRLQEAP